LLSFPLCPSIINTFDYEPKTSSLLLHSSSLSGCVTRKEKKRFCISKEEEKVCEKIIKYFSGLSAEESPDESVYI